MAKIKLSDNQTKALRILQMYPTAIIMSDGWLTGGHGICFDNRTVNALRNKDLITYERRISELGKTIEID